MVAQQEAIPAAPQGEELICRHYWVIEPATGPTSLGVCQSCREAKEFKNYIESEAMNSPRHTEIVSLGGEE